MAVQLARRGLCASFDEAMKWTPRKMAAVLSIESQLHRADLRQQLAVNTMAARGDPKEINKTLKVDQ